MQELKITVLKRMFNQDIADEYRRPEINAVPCPLFSDGQEFVVDFTDYLPEKPENFCDWAWNDIHKSSQILMRGGGVGGWMKVNNATIACCTDGVRPVVFKLERIEE